jgi:hypothetical protein
VTDQSDDRRRRLEEAVARYEREIERLRAELRRRADESPSSSFLIWIFGGVVVGTVIGCTIGGIVIALRERLRARPRRLAAGPDVDPPP